MNTSLGYAKKTLTNSNVLLSGGGDKALSEFIGSLNWDSANKKLQYKSASSTNFTDLITFSEGTNVQITTNNDVITITATDTWNANALGVAGYVAAPTKEANANMTWLTDADGNPAWRVSNSHSHSYLPLAGGTLTGTLNIEGDLCLTKGGTNQNRTFGFIRSNGNTNMDIGWSWNNTDGSGAFFRNSDGGGGFGFFARSSSGTKLLVGNVNGSLTWDDKAILHTGNYSTYALPLAGGTMTGAIKRIYSSASTDPALLVGSTNLDIIIWKVYSSDMTYTADASMYGYSLKYLGTGSGNDNKLVLYSDNQTGTKVAAITVTLDGAVTIRNLNGYLAGAADRAGYLKGGDHRSTDNVPSWYMSNPSTASLYGEFCQAGGATGSYEYRMTMTPWSDSSGQRPVQMAFNNAGAFLRTASSDSAWDSWYKILTAGNWTNIIDGRYVLKSGDTMTGTLQLNNGMTVSGKRSYFNAGVEFNKPVYVNDSLYVNDLARFYGSVEFNNLVSTSYGLSVGATISGRNLYIDGYSSFGNGVSIDGSLYVHNSIYLSLDVYAYDYITYSIPTTNYSISEIFYAAPNTRSLGNTHANYIRKMTFSNFCSLLRSSVLSDYLPLTGGTMTDAITFNYGNYYTDQFIHFKASDNIVYSFGMRRPASTYGLCFVDNGSYYKVWHEGNDGSGSGLEADTVDGYHYDGLPYIKRANWWNSSDTHDVDTLRSGTTFAYSSHNAPTTGTIVAFSCFDDINYTLQLQGLYGGENLYFRNRNGDNGTWLAWRHVIHSGNIGSQSVNYATSANYATYINRIWQRAHNCLADDIPVENRTTFYMYDSDTSNRPSNASGFMIANGWDWGKGGSLIAQNFDDNDGGRLYTNFRQCDGNWNGWKKVAFVDDISNYYWANVKVSTSSSTDTVPTFLHAYLKYYLYMQDSGGNYRAAIDRSGNSPIFGYGFGQAGYHVYYTGYTVSLNAGTDWSSTGNGIYIDSSNNVGIGTSSPSYKLHVAGDIAVSTESCFIGYMPRKKSDGGGWAYETFQIKDYAGTGFAHLGVYGNNNSLAYIFIGSNSYDSTANLRIDTSGYTTATGYAKINSSDSYVLLGGGGHKALSNLSVTGTASSLTSLDTSKTFIYASLSSSVTASNFTLSAAMSVGQCLTVLIYNSSNATISIEVPSSWQSLDGSTLNCGASKFLEISIVCYASGSYILSSKAQ